MRRKSKQVQREPLVGQCKNSQAVLDMLGTLENEKKHDWKKYVKSLVYCTPRETTRLSPFELMFGCKAWLPNDAAYESIELETNEPRASRTSVEYAEEVQYRIATIRKIVEQRVEQSKGKQR